MPLITIANRRPLQAYLVLSDFLGLFAAFNFAFWLRLGFVRSDYLLEYDLIYIFLTTLSMFYIFFLYSPNSKILGMNTTLRSLFSVIVLGLSIAVGIYLFGGKASEQYGRGVLLGALAIFAAWVVVSRKFMDRWCIARGHRLRWLVLGDEEHLPQIWTDFQRFPVEGTLQFLSPTGRYIEDLPIVGKWEELELWLKRDWTGIVIGTKAPLTESLENALLQVRLTGTRVYSLINFYEDIWQKMPIYYMDRSWLTFTDGFALIHNPIGLRIKRIIDIILSLFLLPIAIPLMAVCGLLIFVESGGPVIYHQIRTGLQGKAFRLYKLRTMVQDAEASGAQWAKPRDNRITQVGQFLRKSRLDELPQIWNVLVGDMSFIGPRPERPEFNEKLEKLIPHYSLRHIVRPGITGWAQVLYRYGSTVEDAREKLQYDLFYIKDYSLLLDIVILFRTIRIVIFGAGR